MESANHILTSPYKPEWHRRTYDLIELFPVIENKGVDLRIRGFIRKTLILDYCELTIRGWVVWKQTCCTSESC